MIRPVTCLCLALAAGSGLYLYQVKHQAQTLDRDITRTIKSADATRQRAGLLRAEYALLNDPSRLGDLATQLLPGLKTTAPGQFTTFADLERRLPAVGPPPDAAPPAEPSAPVAVQPAVPEDVPVAAEPSGPAEVAHAEPARPEPARPVVAAAAAPAPAKPALLRPAPRPQPVFATSGPAVTPTVVAMRRPEPAPAPRPAEPVMQATPVVASGSLLGMARILAPPPMPPGNSTLNVGGGR